MNLEQLIANVTLELTAKREAEADLERAAAEKERQHSQEMIARFKASLAADLGEEFLAELSGSCECSYVINVRPELELEYCGQDFKVWKEIRRGEFSQVYYLSIEKTGGYDIAGSPGEFKKLLIRALAAAQLDHRQAEKARRESEEIQAEIDRTLAALPQYQIKPFKLYRWAFVAGDEIIEGYTPTAQFSSAAIPMVARGELRRFRLTAVGNIAIEEFSILTLQDLPAAVVRPRRIDFPGVGTYDGSLAFYRHEKATWREEVGLEPVPAFLDLIEELLPGAITLD